MVRCPVMVSLGFALIFLHTFACYATPNTANEDDTSSSDNLLPCSYKGMILFHDESVRVDDCVVCTCFNASNTCNIQSCPIITCSNYHEPVLQRDGQCCETCPEYSTVVSIIGAQDIDGCIVKGKQFPLGGVDKIDDCTTCTCQANTEMRCEFEKCSSSPCHNRNEVKIEGECCRVCKYDLPIWSVQPSEPNALTSGELNDVVFDLVIRVNSRTGSVGAAGDDLIKVSAWAADEAGNRVGYIDQALTHDQASGHINRPAIKDIVGNVAFERNVGFEHRIDGIEFALDASDARCSQMKYLCVEIGKGDNPKLLDPRLPFTVEGVVDEFNDTEVPSNMVGCIPFPACQDGGKRNQVSFSVAKKSGQIALEPVAVLGWSDVYNNVGGAFDSDTGVFTSYTSGSYFFTYQLTEIPNIQTPQVRLMKNDEVTHKGSSNSIILDLEPGDLVWLQVQGELVGSPERYSTFSGFLL